MFQNPYDMELELHERTESVRREVASTGSRAPRQGDENSAARNGLHALARPAIAWWLPAVLALGALVGIALGSA